MLGFFLAAVPLLRSQVDWLPVEHVMANAPPLQMEINAVFLDSVGFLWIGCQNGLVRYNGYQVVPCRIDEGNAVVDDPSVRGICEGQDGSLWLATARGLVNFDPTRRRSVRFRHDARRPDTISADDLTCLCLSPALPGRIWIASANGDLDQLDLENGKITRTAIAAVRRPGRIRVISGDRDGSLWIGAVNGLYRFFPLEGRLQFCPPPDAVPGSTESFSVSAIFHDEGFSDMLWIGSDGAGLYRYLPAAGLWQRATEAMPTGHMANDIGIHAIASFPGEPQNLLIGTENGLYHFDPRRGRFKRMTMIFNMTDVQPSQCTRVITRDRQGIFWIGSCRNGLDKWSPAGKKFSHFEPYSTTMPNPLANWVTSMQQLAGDDFLLTTYGGGAVIFNRRTTVFRRLWLDPARPERKLNAFITDSFIDSGGGLWFATAEGLARCAADGRLQRLYRYTAAEADKTDFLVFILCRDAAGCIWLGTDQGLLRIDAENGDLRRFRYDRLDKKSLSNDRVNAILKAGDDLWVGTDDGLNLLRAGGGDFAVFKNDPADPASLSGNRVTFIAKDTLGRIWICTSNGLNLLRREGGRVFFRRFMAPGSDSRQNSFLSLIEENSRNFWLGSKAGLARFDTELGTYTFYDRRDGVVADGINEVFFFFRSRGDEFFFCGRSGFTAFRPAAFILNPHRPPLVVTELRIEQDVESTTSMHGTGKKNVRLELAALDFVRPEKNQYAYLLEGRDHDWIYQGTERVVLLSGLPMGLYTLRAKAANNDGIWNENELSIQIRVRPPFLEQYGFFILIGGLLAVLTVVFLRARRRSRRLRNAHIPDNLDLILEKFAISKREAEIVRLLLVGKTNKEIEAQLFIALATVKIHVHNIFRKIKVGNRLQLLLRIQREAKKLE